MGRPIRLKNNTWRIRWHDDQGLRLSATFSTWHEAQRQLTTRQAEVQEVRAGRRRPAPPKVYSFDDLADYWRTHRVARKRSGKDDESILRCHLLTAFGGCPLRELGVERIDRFRGRLGHLSPKTVSNILTLLGTMLRLARDLEWIDRLPRIDKPKVRSGAEDYSWLRSAGEIERLLRAARDYGEHAFVLYATAVYTGLRQGELAALAWDRVDLERRLITVDRSFKGPTKGGRVRYVPILDVLLPVLRAWRLLGGGSGLVFPNERGRMQTPGARIFKDRFHRVLDAAGFERPVVGRQVHYIRFHDLRHTFASHWVMRGGDLFKLQKILGHKSIEMTLRYAHLCPSAFADDHGRFGPDACGGRGEVVPLGAVAKDVVGADWGTR